MRNLALDIIALKVLLIISTSLQANELFSHVNKTNKLIKETPLRITVIQNSSVDAENGVISEWSYVGSQRNYIYRNNLNKTGLEYRGFNGEDYFSVMNEVYYVENSSNVKTFLMPSFTLFGLVESNSAFDAVETLNDIDGNPNIKIISSKKDGSSSEIFLSKNDGQLSNGIKRVILFKFSFINGNIAKKEVGYGLFDESGEEITSYHPRYKVLYEYNKGDIIPRSMNMVMHKLKQFNSTEYSFSETFANNPEWYSYEIKWEKINASDIKELTSISKYPVKGQRVVDRNLDVSYIHE